MLLSLLLIVYGFFRIGGGAEMGGGDVVNTTGFCFENSSWNKVGWFLDI